MKPKKKALFGAVLLILFAMLGCSVQSPAVQTDSSTAEASTAATSETTFPSNKASMLYFLNVGKADAALIQSQGQYYLIDTGTEASLPSLIGSLRVIGVERLSGIFLTHSHKDHTGGLEGILSVLEVERIFYPKMSETIKRIQKIEELCHEAGISITKLTQGDTWSIGDGTIHILGPIQEQEDENDQSLVMMISFYGKNVLLMGDAQFAEENALLTQNIDLKADILKVGNHGNPDATGNEFAKQVSPAISIISTNTEEDSDSANARVQEALRGSQILLTQMVSCGYAVCIEDNGAIRTQKLERLAKDNAMSIEKVDTDQQSITLKNISGQDINLSGWMIFEEKSGKLYSFPENSICGQGQAITVSCLGNSGDFIWPQDKVWKKKNEKAILLDPYGNTVSEFQVTE